MYLNNVLGYWNENFDSYFRFNNPRQCSNWIIFVSFCSSHLAIKKYYNVHFMKIKKIVAKIDLKIQKSLHTTTKTWTFKRNYLENYNDSEHAVKTKNAPFFMIFPNISFFSYGWKLLDWSFNPWNGFLLIPPNSGGLLPFFE